MTDEPIVKRRGRPVGSKNKKNDGKPKELPSCTKSELAKYPKDGIIVVWGVQPACERFKRKGLAVLFNPEHKGGMVTLMPVTTDDAGELIWRYRYLQAPMPFRYEKIDLEPGQSASIPKVLRDVADTIESGVVKWFGSQEAADKTSQDFLESKRGDRLGDKFKKMDLF
jgi:hypothetical protein